MNLQRYKRVIISGGGTGGHIFPAISIANALRRLDRDIEILFVGAEGRMEMEKVPAAGYRIIGLPVAGFDRKHIFRNLGVFIKLCKSLRLAKKTIKEFNPDVAVGVGGYASGPVLKQAERLGIPVLIQEQNSTSGVTNKLLAGKASVICVAYDGMDRYFPADRLVKTGNPVRQNFDNLGQLRKEALGFFNLSDDLPVILILGGSLGAGKINKVLSDNIETVNNSGCQVVWQTGKSYYEKVKKIVKESSAGNIAVYPFIDNMDLAFSAADVIVSRAGAGTISELCLVGKPVILVPSPNVAEDHQTRNAKALEENGAAIVIADDMVEKLLLNEMTKLVFDIQKKRILSENISKMAERDADLRIAKEVIKLIKND
jgi:UDP-N-acetylglucosamine--N-acetylmuramyl-(pentapeptide) pyrophosphoryl-undecaprenol N-acetylglucosamine transferase